MWTLLVLLLTEAAAEDATVEHRVTRPEAARALHLLNLTQLEGHGCRPCTDRQRGYCLSDDLLSDHCTCDHRHVERLPYVEHTCYVPSRVPPTFATDCLEYVRLLECCCHAALLPLMKNAHAHGDATSSHLAPYLLPFLLVPQWIRL